MLDVPPGRELDVQRVAVVEAPGLENSRLPAYHQVSELAADSQYVPREVNLSVGRFEPIESAQQVIADAPDPQVAGSAIEISDEQNVVSTQDGQFVETEPASTSTVMDEHDDEIEPQRAPADRRATSTEAAAPDFESGPRPDSYGPGPVRWEGAPSAARAEWSGAETNTEQLETLLRELVTLTQLNFAALQQIIDNGLKLYV
jgi:hypothetical protein